MSTDTIETEANILTGEFPHPDDEAPETIPMSDSVEVGGDIEAAVDEEHHEIARAEAEGMTGIVPAIPDERSTRQKLEDAERAEAIEEATAEVCSMQAIAERKKSAYLIAKEEASDAKKAAESADDDYREAGRRLRLLRESRFPDGDKYPMFDTPPKPDPAKQAIHDAFPSPEKIPPLPPDDFAEFLRRKQVATPVESMGLKKATVKALLKHELSTAGKVVAQWNGAGLGKLSGMTEDRQEEIANALIELTEAAQAEWDALHPSEPVATPEPDEDAEIDSMLDAEEEEAEHGDD